MKTVAVIQARLGSTLTLRGFAFSGAPDIAKVEVSDDDGATWMPATLDPRHDPHGGGDVVVEAARFVGPATVHAGRR